MSIRKWMEGRGGVAGIPDLADEFDVSRGFLRNWAVENDVAMVGNAFIFVTEDAEAVEADIADVDDEGDLEVEEDDESFGDEDE